MTDNGFPDALEKVIGALNTALPLAYVGDELPPQTALENRLPIVLVQDVPGGSQAVPWQAGGGPLIDVFAADFYILGRNREQSREYAARTRGILFSLVYRDDIEIKKVIEVSAFSRATDFNPRVKREHGEYHFHIGRDTA
ncbi:tail terminator [Gordonia phage Frokostdame]|uniref:Tail terminator n=1 Tax=Gordonia phage Frokostdame TaxID=2250320 RepID=A0A345L303_9CAUD|nr:tail terminator [Gordonia phage Frokostdame]AXH49655.1 tail terminator [Gordonia phage Frokostdame]